MLISTVIQHLDAKKFLQTICINHTGSLGANCNGLYNADHEYDISEFTKDMPIKCQLFKIFTPLNDKNNLTKNYWTSGKSVTFQQ